MNAPLVTGDRIFSGFGGRVEVQLAPAIYTRFGPDTELDLVELAPTTTHPTV